MPERNARALRKKVHAQGQDKREVPFMLDEGYLPAEAAKVQIRAGIHGHNME